MNIKDMANAYESTSIKNIADLDSVSVDIETYEIVFKEGSPDEYRNFVALIDGEEYRVPVVVLRDLKTILETKPSMTHFKVTKTGSGKEGTRYTVIPL